MLTIILTSLVVAAILGGCFLIGCGIAKAIIWTAENPKLAAGLPCVVCHLIALALIVVAWTTGNLWLIAVSNSFTALAIALS